MAYSEHYSVATYGTISVIGKSKPPGSVTSMSVQIDMGAAYINWAVVEDIDVVYGGSYVIKHTSMESSSMSHKDWIDTFADIVWGSATVVATGIPGGSSTLTVPAASGTYLIKAVDSSGFESVFPAIASSDIHEVETTANAVYYAEQGGTVAFGSTTISKGVEDPRSSNIYYNPLSNSIELDTPSLATGSHNPIYATGVHEDDVVSSGTNTNTIASGMHDAAVVPSSSEYQAVNMVDTHPGMFDSKSGLMDTVVFTPSKLEDELASFTSSVLGLNIRNLRTGAVSSITSVDSPYILSLSTSIFSGVGDHYRIEVLDNILRDKSASFTASMVGTTVLNSNAGTSATISSIISSTEVTLSTPIFANSHGDAWAVPVPAGSLRSTTALFTATLVGRLARNLSTGATSNITGFTDSKQIVLASGIFDTGTGVPYEIEPGFDRLYDPSAAFTDELVGKVALNTVTGARANILSRSDSYELVLDSNIFDNRDGEGYTIEVVTKSLRDPGAPSMTPHIGKIIRNIDTGGKAVLTGVDSYNTMSLTDDIFGTTAVASYKVQGDRYSSGTYYFADAPVDLGGVYTSILATSAFSTPKLMFDLFDVVTGNFDSLTGLFEGGVGVTDVSSSLEVRSTSNDPSDPSATWSSWANVVVGSYTGRGFEFRLNITSGHLSHNLEVSNLSVTLDMPDTVRRGGTNIETYYGEGESSADVLYSTPFHGTNPIVGITIQNADPGDYYTISANTETGFTVTFYNSGNLATQKTFNWISIGY